jgi:succinyl-diaminopimelate desuccinylase
MMQKYILSLAKKLIAIQSTSKNPKALEEALNLAISYTKEFPVKRFERNGIKSVLIHNQNRATKKFKVILNGHLDVVPGKDYQYKPRIQDGKLYGVGSMDMKANVACLIAVFNAVARKIAYPLALQLVTDEEIGGFHGTKYQIDKGIRAEFVIAGETTNFHIAHKAKGILWAKISAKGKTAHGAYPWRGENAIWNMNVFLNTLQKTFPVPTEEVWATTVNLSRIETTNQSFNKIPDDCSASLDIRYIPEDKDTIQEDITKLLPKGCTIDFLVNESPLFVDKDNMYVQSLKKVAEQITRKKIALYGANGSSDARHFTAVGCNGIEFGPIGGGIGTDNEWVDIQSLNTYYTILTTFLSSL